MARADATATAQKTPGHVVCNDDGLDEKDALAPAASEVGAQQAVAVHSMLERAGCNTNWLSLIGASLTAVPAKINPSSFPFLTQLYLGHNRIKALPDALFSLFSLRGLFLQNNHIARLSPKINHLTELQELYLSSNLLSCVPPLGSLALLDCLWLDDNPHLPVMLTRNISRNKESVQHLIHQVSFGILSFFFFSLLRILIMCVRLVTIMATAAATVVAACFFSCAELREASV